MTSFHLTTIKDLTPADWSVWLDIQERTGLYESPYFRPEFAQAVAAVRNDVEVAILKQDGQTVGFFPFQRGKLNLGKPVGGKLSDYHGPLLRHTAKLDPLDLLRSCRLAAWDFDHLVSPNISFASHVVSLDKSPQLDLAEGFAAFVRRRRAAGSDTVQRQGQKIRKLAREVGPLDFTFDAPNDTEAFELLKTWKSAQYLRTGLSDVFAFPWTLTLLDRLCEHRTTDFAAPLSVLRAGNQVAAVALSLVSRGLLHSWFVTYNPGLASYSPGMTLFIRLAEEGQSLGIRKIDLGRGSERYKWSLASGSVEVAEGSITSPSLATWLRSRWRSARNFVSNSPLKETTRLPAKLIQPLRNWLAYH
jgi:CelD/BcsL family acetyltransferase involved in cellulose biosynthesis